MSTLSDFLHALARKCRYWSNNVMELGAAKELRTMASDLDKKAEECQGVDCPQDIGQTVVRMRERRRA